MKILDVPQSGSIAGSTSSRNRFGQYRRTRATPVNPNTSAQSAARTRLADNSANWRGITDAQRMGWGSLGAMIQRQDSLGQTYTLTGFQAYVSVNNTLMASGDAPVDDAPALDTPAVIATAAITLSDVAFSIAYTPTPLGAGEKLFIFASPQRSAGRTFENDYRLITVTAAAAASPANILADYTAKFGVPVTGNKVCLSLQVMRNGFLSGAFLTAAVVA